MCKEEGSYTELTPLYGHPLSLSLVNRFDRVYRSLRAIVKQGEVKLISEAIIAKPHGPCTPIKLTYTTNSFSSYITQIIV